jgi:hypothetical protein
MDDIRGGSIGGSGGALPVKAARGGEERTMTVEDERLPERSVVQSVQEKVNEYGVLVAPVEQAIRELQLARGMLRARAEDEIHALSPALAALSESLGISTLDLLTASDREGFLREAVRRADLPVDEIRRRLVAAGVGAGEQLRALGLPTETA